MCQQDTCIDAAQDARIPAFTYECPSSALMDRARDVATFLGGDPNAVICRPEERNTYAFFEVTLPDGAYFLKLLRAPELAATWRERDNAVFAAERGWGPAALAPAKFPDALLTRLLPGEPMAWYEVAQPDAWPHLLRSIKAVHDSMEKRPPDADADITAGAQGRLDQLRERDRPEIVSLDMLQERINKLHLELTTYAIERVYCHRDFHMGNVLTNGPGLDGKLWIIDWEYADWSDPWLEVARFAALAHMSSAQAPALVEVYTGRTPQAWEVRYVRLCMAAINIEFFSQNYRLNGTTPMTLRYLQAIHNDGEYLQ